MSLSWQKLTDIREGRRGIALALYIDVPEDDWEEYSLAVPSVLALEAAVGKQVLEALRTAVQAGTAEALTDDASEAVRLLLASDLRHQAFVAPMLEGISGRGVESPEHFVPIS